MGIIESWNTLGGVFIGISRSLFRVFGLFGTAPFGLPDFVESIEGVYSFGKRSDPMERKPCLDSMAGFTGQFRQLGGGITFGFSGLCIHISNFGNL
jgi:hypothetical protein